MICTRSRCRPRQASGGRARPRRDLRRPRRADARHRAQLVVPRAHQTMGRQRRASTALARSSALARARPWPSTIASSSLSPSAAAPSRCSFSRGRSCGATVFIVHHTLLYFRVDASSVRPAMRDRLRVASSQPPARSLPRKRSIARSRRSTRPHRRRGAVRAAALRRRDRRAAAGARSRGQRDYRLALSRAVDASDRAQEAAKAAADNKARAAAQVKRAVSRANAALRQLEARRQGRRAAHVPARELAPARTAIRTPRQPCKKHARCSPRRTTWRRPRRSRVSRNRFARRFASWTRRPRFGPLDGRRASGRERRKRRRVMEPRRWQNLRPRRCTELPVTAAKTISRGGTRRSESLRRLPTAFQRPRFARFEAIRRPLSASKAAAQQLRGDPARRLPR